MLRTLFLLMVVVSAAVASSQFMSFTVTSRFMLMVNPDVKKELKITKAQDKQVQELLPGRGTAPTMVDMGKGFEEKLDGILDADQRKRLEELFLQANGGWALTDTKVATVLALKPEQVDQIKSVSEEGNQAVTGMMTSIRSNDDLKKMKAKKKEFGDKMKAFLTAEQTTQFDALLGKPFKFKNL